MSESLEERYKRKEAEMWARMKAGGDRAFYMDAQSPAGNCHGLSSTTAAKMKKMLEDLKPTINVGRSWQNAYIVMPQDLMSHAMQIRPEMFVENLSEPTPYRFMHQFNYMPMYTNPFRFVADHGLARESDWPVETTPVLPQLMAEYVPDVKQKDPSFWQAMVCVVVLGWMLVSLGGAL